MPRKQDWARQEARRRISAGRNTNGMSETLLYASLLNSSENPYCHDSDVGGPGTGDAEMDRSSSYDAGTSYGDSGSSSYDSGSSYSSGDSGGGYSGGGDSGGGGF